MKVLAGVGAALAAALVTGGLLAGQAFAAPAQPPAPNSGCGAALLALSNAEKAAADAVAADKAADDAKRADDDLADANVAVDDARAAGVNGGVPSASLTAATLQALRTERTEILAIPEPRPADKVDRLIVVERQIPLVEAFLAAQAKVVVAKSAADKTDAEALRRAATQTDAVKLADDATKASTAADRACGNNTPGGVHFENCDQVRNAGVAPLRFDQPGYRVGLDADRDGIACEAVEDTPRPRAPRIPTAIDTGYTPDQG